MSVRRAKEKLINEKSSQRKPFIPLIACFHMGPHGFKKKSPGASFHGLGFGLGVFVVDDRGKCARDARSLGAPGGAAAADVATYAEKHLRGVAKNTCACASCASAHPSAPMRKVEDEHRREKQCMDHHKRHLSKRPNQHGTTIRARTPNASVAASK